MARDGPQRAKVGNTLIFHDAEIERCLVDLLVSIQWTARRRPEGPECSLPLSNVPRILLPGTKGQMCGQKGTRSSLAATGLSKCKIAWKFW